MRPIEQLLTQYAAYHRDRRNIATHLVGVPTIVFLDAQGRERTDLRLVDYLPPEAFLNRMAELKRSLSAP